MIFPFCFINKEALAAFMYFQCELALIEVTCTLFLLFHRRYVGVPPHD